MNNKEYILGGNTDELNRLQFQHEVWKNVTDEIVNSENISKGSRCLDVGAGPGFVSFEMREIIGDSGEVVAIEPLEIYTENIKRVKENQGWENIKIINENIENADLEKESFDFIYLRWVIDFLREPDKVIQNLITLLKPGGRIAVMDYVYEGLALHPKGGAFDKAPEYVKQYYQSGGGDPYFPVKLVKIFRENKIAMINFTPYILSGDYQSNVIQWAHLFFTLHIPKMILNKIVTEKEGNAMLEDWLNHRENPDTVFFSPVVVNAMGEKIS